jgi:hypothetical protein
VYRPDVLQALWRHGVQPTERTPPELVRGFVRDLYRYQLRCLRERYMRNEFPKRDYWDRVVELRDRYPVLALTARQWIVD